MNDIDKIKDRITKLLAMTNDASSPHEAEIASRRAEKLMVQWGIQEAELKGSLHEDIVQVTREYRGGQAASSVLAVNLVCIGLGNLRVLQSTDRRTAWIIGFKSDVERATMLLDSLEMQEKSARKAWWKNAPEREYLSRWEAHKAQRTFLVSFATVVYKRLTQMREEAIQETGHAASTELVLVGRRDKVDAYVKDRHNARQSRGRMHGSYYGREAGRQAGSRATIDNTRGHLE